MKKLFALSFLTALMLAGCGVDEPNEEISKPDSVRVPTTEATTEPETTTTTATTTRATTTRATTTKATTTAVTTTTYATTTKAAGSTATFTDRLDSYAELYKAEVQRVWDETYNANDGTVMIDYVLYDIDNDRIPELIFNHGTCEADMQITVYTVDLDAKLKKVGEVGGGHAVFAEDDSEDADNRAFVLVQGHMGYMTIRWFTLGDDFTLSERRNLEHELKADEDYESVEWDNSVWRLDYISAYNMDKNSKPKSYYNYAYSEAEEQDGLVLDFNYDNGWLR
ncbi:MAG: hypothetical protein K6G82_06325 [Ruminococcus sp.]|nr:hypothetical protein [Ruminococcus sp.]